MNNSKETTQCPGCGGFCKKSGCERDDARSTAALQPEKKCDNCGEFGECCQRPKQEQGEPVAKVVRDGATMKLEWHSVEAAHNAKEGNLYTTPQQRKPLTFPKEASAFKKWFDAWWLGDGEQGESIPSQSDPKFSDYVSQYTFGFGAWMAAKHAARSIKNSVSFE